MRSAYLIALCIILTGSTLSSDTCGATVRNKNPENQAVFSIAVSDEHIIQIHQEYLYFRLLNTCSIQIQKIAESQLSLPFDSQHRAIDLLREILEDCRHPCPDWFVEKTSSDIKTLQGELDRYTVLLEYVDRVHQRIMVDLTSYQQYCSQDEFVLFIDRIGIRENTRLMNDLSEHSTLIHVDH